MEWVVVFIGLVVVFVIVQDRLRTRTGNALGIPGEIVWTDTGRDVKPFGHTTFRVAGKPDFIVKDGSTLTAVEYKSRKRRVFESDVKQAFAASLAARGDGWPIDEVVVKTALEIKRYTLPESDHALFNLISEEADLVREALKGNPVPARPQKTKCNACAYVESCRAA